MVKEAKMKEVSSEKSLKEAKMQLEGLQAEVSALKALLITSTPSRPNLGGGNGMSLFKKQHKRTPSHNHLQYGRADEDAGNNE
jgi:Rab-3A-interacting protein